MPMDPEARRIARECKGFFDEQEGLRLYELAREHARLGPVVEVGSYCGKSSVYLGAGAKEAGGTLVCVDHHRGSEEHQRGEQYHDPALYDAEAGAMDSLGELRRTFRRAGLERTAALLVTDSVTAAGLVAGPVGLVLVDGGHSLETASADLDAWAPLVAPGGILAIHDLFPDPAEGGQAPITIYRRALASGRFDERPATKTLGVLVRNRS